MADDLISIIDEATKATLEKAQAGDDLDKCFEALKFAASWAERRAKLQPVAKPPTGEKFNKLKGQLHGKRNGAVGGRGTSAAPEDGDPSAT